MATPDPYTGTPQVAPDLRPMSPVQVNAPIQAFGGATGAAEEHLSSAIAQGGNELFARAIAMKELDNQAQALNATADASDKFSLRLNQFRQLGGKAAQDALPGLISDLNSIRDEGGKDLNPYAQKLYLQNTRTNQTRMVEAAGTHAGEQFKHYQEGTAQVAVDSSIRATGINPSSDGVYRDTIANIDTQAKAMQDIKGWSDDERDHFAATHKDLAVFERATNLARENPGAAQKFLDDEVKAGNVSGDTAGKAGDYIRNHVFAVTARQEAPRLLNGEGGYFTEGATSLPMTKYKAAVSANESGGSYDPPHPLVTSGAYAGQRAVGKYGMMEGNLDGRNANWIKEAANAGVDINPNLTVDQFRHSPEAQEKLFEFKFGQLVKNHADAANPVEEALHDWFGHGVKGDGYHTWEWYKQNANKTLAKEASPTELSTIAQRRADQLVPGNLEFAQHFDQITTNQHQLARRQEAQTEFDSYQTVSNALTTPGADGKLPQSMDELSPDVHNLVLGMNDKYQKSFRAQIEHNINQVYDHTPETKADFMKWYGIMKGGDSISPEERKEALDTNFLDKHWPVSDVKQMLGLQKALWMNTDKNPQIGQALSMLRGQVDAIKMKTSSNDYQSFRGAFIKAVELQADQDGKPPNMETMRAIGNELLREHVTKSAFGSWFDGKPTPAFKEPVPKEFREEILRQFQTDHPGATLNDREVQQIYAAQRAREQFNQFYTKKSKPQAGL